MAIGVHREGHAAVTQSLADGLRVHVVLVHPRGMAVAAEVIRPDHWEIDTPDDAPEVPAGDILPVERPAIILAEDERAVFAEVMILCAKLLAQRVLCGLQIA